MGRTKAYVRVYQCLEPSRSSSNTMSSHGSRSHGKKRSSKSSNTSYTSSTGQSLRSSAYDRDFEQKCVDHGIYMPSQRDKPGNWQEAQDALANPRPSLSPSRFSDDAFDRFCQIEAETRNKNDVITEALPIVLGEKRRDYPSAGDIPFRNMDDMAQMYSKSPSPTFIGEHDQGRSTDELGKT